MAAEADPKRGASSIPGTAEPASAGRRFLLRGGLGAAPVLMTLVSDPVAARVCKTASAFTSITTSGRTSTVTCTGKSPSAWASDTSIWPSPYDSNTKFPDVFSPALTPPNSQAKLTNILVGGSGIPELAQHCTAAVLNAAKGLVPSTILSAATAKSIWAAIGGGGYYEPTAGVQWYAPEAINWIKSTYGP